MRRDILLKAIAGTLAVNIALACALLIYVNRSNAFLPKRKSADPSIVFRTPKDHPVTAAMLNAAKALGGVKAAEFEGRDTNGQPCSFASLTKSTPLLLYFVEYQCPCCKSAKPYIDRIQNYYGDVCNVIGVIDANEHLAEAWTKLTYPQFRVLPDPDMKIIRSYHAVRGTYSILIAPGGHIVKMFPGYCQEMLKTIGADIARLSGTPERPMPLAPAPKRMTSGCIFPGTKLPGDEL